MRFYLAARYSRRLELCEYRKVLESRGHIVTSRWLNGNHQISDHGVPLGDHGEQLVEGLEGDGGGESPRAAQLRQAFAREDVNDVQNCDVLIAFTEPPRSSASRGGRHVELGIAIGLSKEVIVIGYRENIFCWLDRVTFFSNWDEFTSLALCAENIAAHSL